MKYIFLADENQAELKHHADMFKENGYLLLYQLTPGQNPPKDWPQLDNPVIELEEDDEIIYHWCCKNDVILITANVKHFIEQERNWNEGLRILSVKQRQYNKDGVRRLVQSIKYAEEQQEFDKRPCGKRHRNGPAPESFWSVRRCKPDHLCPTYEQPAYRVYDP